MSSGLISVPVLTRKLAQALPTISVVWASAGILKGALCQTQAYCVLLTVAAALPNARTSQMQLFAEDTQYRAKLPPAREIGALPTIPKICAGAEVWTDPILQLHRKCRVEPGDESVGAAPSDRHEVRSAPKSIAAGAACIPRRARGDRCMFPNIITSAGAHPIESKRGAWRMR